jgi:hypothetical protein
MVTKIAKDSKGHNRNLDVTGMIKPSGMVCAKVTNDQEEVYFVVIASNGKTSCRSKKPHGKECAGHSSTGHCYHVAAVLSANLPAYQELVMTPDEIAAVAEEHNMQKLADLRNVYEVVGDPRIEPTYSHECGHLVKAGHEDEMCGGCCQKMYS